MNTKQYALENSLGYLAGRLVRLLLKRNVDQFHSHGISITSEQWIALVHLWDEDGIHQQRLADLMHHDRAATTRLLNTLEKRGLLYRLPSQSDGREKNVYLSDTGRVVMRQATELVHGVLNKTYAGIDDEKLEVCRDVLRHAYLNLE